MHIILYILQILSDMAFFFFISDLPLGFRLISVEWLISHLRMLPHLKNTERSELGSSINGLIRFNYPPTKNGHGSVQEIVQKVEIVIDIKTVGLAHDDIPRSAKCVIKLTLEFFSWKKMKNQMMSQINFSTLKKSILDLRVEFS